MVKENKLYLKDLIKMDDLNNVKVKFSLNNGYVDPIELYIKNPDIINKEWLFWRNKVRYFNVGEIVIFLVRMHSDFWLLTTIKKVTKEYGISNGVNYEGEELEEYKNLYGRTIIKYHKKFQNPVRHAKGFIDDLEVSQILPSIFDGEDFPGYDKVRLTYNTLKSILDRNKRDWINSLENQKAIYLITDSNNGKKYVGSAYGDKGMLLQRWKNYIHNGHGGNEGLKEVFEKEGFEYIKNNFVYSILEIYNSKIDDNYIIGRETWWKETLMTKEFGYNRN